MHVRTPTQWTALWRETAVRRAVNRRRRPNTVLVFVRRARGHHVFFQSFSRPAAADAVFQRLIICKSVSPIFHPKKWPTTWIKKFLSAITTLVPGLIVGPAEGKPDRRSRCGDGDRANAATSARVRRWPDVVNHTSTVKTYAERTIVLYYDTRITYNAPTRKNVKEIFKIPHHHEPTAVVVVS